MEFEDQEEHEEEIGLPTSYDSFGNSTRVKMATSGGEGSPAPRKPRYRECLKNHAVSIGGHAVDGCGEFMAAGAEGTLDALKCAACNCHRNFHRKLVSSTPFAEGRQQQSAAAVESPESERSEGHKKRLRTKFTADQKEKMLAFAEKIRWKMQRKEEEDEIEKFCRGVGVSRQVFKVWMHNHKNSSSSSSSASTTLTQ